jgi:type IV secretory pathway VirB6-like protein
MCSVYSLIYFEAPPSINYCNRRAYCCSMHPLYVNDALLSFFWQTNNYRLLHSAGVDFLSCFIGEKYTSLKDFKDFLGISEFYLS